MKLFALALDYDGTIATNDRLDPLVRDAIAAARRRNIAVILVTGRILDELRRVAGDLHFVDAVIAENGALLPHRSFPAITSCCVSPRCVSPCPGAASRFGRWPTWSCRALVHGLFHADPHPGNILVLPGNVVAFIDFGIVGRTSRTLRPRS
jgi:hypothetical protein